MKKAAKRQVVLCPNCRKIKVTLGGTFFRCCGDNHDIKKHLLTADQLQNMKSPEVLEAFA